MNTEVQISQDTPAFITEEELNELLNRQRKAIKEAMDNRAKPISPSLLSGNIIDEVIELFRLGIISKKQARKQLKGEPVYAFTVIELVKSGLMDNQEARKLLLQ